MCKLLILQIWGKFLSVDHWKKGLCSRWFIGFPPHSLRSVQLSVLRRPAALPLVDRPSSWPLRLAVDRGAGLHVDWMVRFSFSISICGNTNTQNGDSNTRATLMVQSVTAAREVQRWRSGVNVLLRRLMLPAGSRAFASPHPALLVAPLSLSWKLYEHIQTVFSTCYTTAAVIIASKSFFGD